MAGLDSFTAPREALAQAARTALSHPLRSSLGALAVAAGVATVATVLIALDGLAEYARATAARTFGADTFVLAQIASPGSLDRRELQDRLERNPPIRRADLRFLERWAGDTVMLAASVQRNGDAVAGGHRFENAAITGTSRALEEIRDLAVARGRFLTQDDEARAAQVAVIGIDVAEALFPGRDPLGLALRVGGRRFLVVGLQARLGTAAGASLDRYLWIPLPTFERVFGPPATLQVFARARDTRQTARAEDRVRATMRARRRLRPGAPDNFDLLSPQATRGFVASLVDRLRSAAAPLGLMAMLASIVVVTNTTLVSVTQRTREIGVRRALGARRRQVVHEVLLEATLVALAGGAAALLAVQVAVLAARAAGAPPLSLDPATAAWSVGAAAGAGLLAGLYPALRASRVDVVAALRLE
jgi:putative ABC transport system permease protein